MRNGPLAKIVKESKKAELNLGVNFFVTGACNQNCKLCAQAPWRADFGGYHMTIEEVGEICATANAIGARYRWAHLTGGEPTLWHYLEAGCRLIKATGAFRQIRIFSNCSDPDRLARLVKNGLVDRISTKETNANRAGLKRLEELVGSTLSVAREEESGGLHLPPPTKAIPGSLPAICRCARPAAFGHRVMICGNAWSNCKRTGTSMDDPKIWTNNREDWEAAFRKIDKYRMEICRSCLANRKVWDKIKTEGGTQCRSEGSP